MGRIASFHLVRERPWRGAAAMARLATDRPRLARVDGLAWSRLLGTGRGSVTTPGADLRRTALFAVWQSEEALDEFLATHPLARRWNAAEEAYSVRLRSLGGHGSWGGHDVLDGITPGDGAGAVAVLTRAVVRRARWRTFARATHPVDAALHRADGLLAVCGIGEAPVGRQATFSLWRSWAAARTFAYAREAHRDVVARTRAEGWYGEELFARLEPYGSTGAWDGVDPLRTGSS
jgi:hypothetical protein